MGHCRSSARRGSCPARPDRARAAGPSGSAPRTPARGSSACSRPCSATSGRSAASRAPSTAARRRRARASTRPADGWRPAPRRDRLVEREPAPAAPAPARAPPASDQHGRCTVDARHASACASLMRAASPSARDEDVFERRGTARTLGIARRRPPRAPREAASTSPAMRRRASRTWSRSPNACTSATPATRRSTSAAASRVLRDHLDQPAGQVRPQAPRRRRPPAPAPRAAARRACSAPLRRDRAWTSRW